MDALTSFAAQHWVFGGIVTSLVWFWAGKQNAKFSAFAVISWLAIALIILLIVLGRGVIERQWAGVGIGLLVLFYEIHGLARVIAKSA